ncbi:MAG: TolC family protein, partial [Elusimicrobiota bacterium]|nr:TolC family protein [Elusimicrobiota bacterium]
FQNIGIEQNSLLEIEGNFGIIDDNTQDLPTSIAKALYIRPELLVSEASEELGFLEVNIAMSEKNPVIALKGTYDYNANVDNQNIITSKSWKPDWFIGLALSIPIIDGGAFLARNNQKKSNLTKLKLMRAETEENIKLEVNKTFLKYELNKKKLDNRKKIYQDFINNKKNSNILLKIKNPKTISINSKQDFMNIFYQIQEYIKIQNNYLESIFDYNNSILDLQIVVGEIS